MARLYDGFTFYNELDLLEIRLAELDPVVDVFVLVEARHTYRGAPKPLYFAENRTRFAPWLSKLRHIVVDNFDDLSRADRLHPRRRPPNANWAREWLQRDAILSGLHDAGPDDLVAVSDVDEIPRRETMAALRADPLTAGRLLFLQQEPRVNRLDWRQTDVEWIGTRILARRHLRSPQAVRMIKPRAHRLTTPGFHWLTHRLRVMRDLRAFIEPAIIRNAGWHFTSMGAAEIIHAKLGDYAHGAESGRTDVTTVARRLEMGLTYLGDAPEIVPIGSMPKAVRDDAARYAHLMSGSAAIAKSRCGGGQA